ncbi:helix-turn-helix domain-containing protein [Micromonospora sp. NPDC094482]|uniref:helix-turn-helix domain-containing protein n=1 Tax=unclassified Micromonospora TaxID=2617518 RepID=UPI003331883D
MPTNPRRSQPPTGPSGPHDPADPSTDTRDPRLYRPAEAAARLRVPESWLRRRAGRRQIPCTFLGKHLRFSEADLAAIIATAAQPSTGRRHPGRRPRPPRDPDLPPPAK